MTTPCQWTGVAQRWRSDPSRWRTTMSELPLVWCLLKMRQRYRSGDENLWRLLGRVVDWGGGDSKIRHDLTSNVARKRVKIGRGWVKVQIGTYAPHSCVLTRHWAQVAVGHLGWREEVKILRGQSQGRILYMFEKMEVSSCALKKMLELVRKLWPSCQLYLREIVHCSIDGGVYKKVDQYHVE